MLRISGALRLIHFQGLTGVIYKVKALPGGLFLLHTVDRFRHCLLPSCEVFFTDNAAEKGTDGLEARRQ